VFLSALVMSRVMCCCKLFSCFCADWMSSFFNQPGIGMVRVTVSSGLVAGCGLYGISLDECC